MNKKDLVRTSINLVDYSGSEEDLDELQDSVSEISGISTISKKKRKTDKPFC